MALAVTLNPNSIESYLVMLLSTIDQRFHETSCFEYFWFRSAHPVCSVCRDVCQVSELTGKLSLVTLCQTKSSLRPSQIYIEYTIYRFVLNAL